MHSSARRLLCHCLTLLPFVLQLTMITMDAAPVRQPDWMIDPSPFRARIEIATDSSQIELNNGLVRRIIQLQPNAATVAFDNLMTGAPLVRAVRPEARVTIDGIDRAVGGLQGQPVQNFLLPEWRRDLKADPAAFQFVSHRTGPTQARFPWKPRREWMPADLPWPAPGRELVLTFRPLSAADVDVEVHYEIYDGLPLISKWIVVLNRSAKPVRVNAFTVELLAVVEPESYVENNPRWDLPLLHVETDYAFGGMGSKGAIHGAQWRVDPDYKTQVNYDLQTPCLLECRPPLGPDQDVAPGGSLESYRVFELAPDSTDRERRGLAQRRFYRAMAPWVTENPVLMHVRSAKPDAVRLAIDQCAEVGFEMVILTFGSGFDFENRDPQYQAGWRELADYGRRKGIALGGYSLLASRGAAKAEENCVGKSTYGVMPCLGAQWGVDYLAQLRGFMERAGLAVLEHDGSYPGDTCAATNHPYHRGLEDSQWVQWRAITGFYRWCRANGVYLNIPDWYFLNGGTKCGMGYRESNWSLPRAHQEIIERQNIFDGTWEKTPGMGWMFVPLTEYQGGGAAATIEPLHEHLPHYRQRLANLFGAGVIACYRGPRLYDTPETRAVVKEWVDFYKRHRAILSSDLLHLRRADGSDLDYILHVNPALPEKGLLMVYNPLDHPVQRQLTVPLYYTGLTDRARVAERDRTLKTHRLDRQANLVLPVTVPAHDVNWYVIR